MNRHLVQLWARSQYNWLRASDVKRGDLLDHTAGNQFKRRSVEPGDYIYVVTVEKQDLYLIGKIKVGQICSQSEAQQILGRDDLWEAEDHVIAEPGSELPMYSDLIVPTAIAEQLIFVDRDGYEPPLGKVDGRKLQSIRDLASGAEKALDALLESRRLLSE